MSELKLINNGRQQSSYKEFTITLTAGQVYQLNNPFNYFRCLETSADFKGAWSTNQMDTDFKKGLGIRFDDVIPYAQIYNPNNATITIKIGVGIGYFDDNRLTLTNTGVPVSEAGFATINASSATGAHNYSVPAGAQISVMCTSDSITINMNNGSIAITNLVLSDGQSWTTRVASAGTLAITGSGSYNYEIGSY